MSQPFHRAKTNGSECSWGISATVIAGKLYLIILNGSAALLGVEGRLEMIENHYGANVIADELDALIGKASERAAERRSTFQTRDLPGTFDEPEDDADTAQKKTPDQSGGFRRAGDRGRTGDVQLGKLAFYH